MPNQPTPLTGMMGAATDPRLLMQLLLGSAAAALTSAVRRGVKPCPDASSGGWTFNTGGFDD